MPHCYDCSLLRSRFSVGPHNKIQFINALEEESAVGKWLAGRGLMISDSPDIDEKSLTLRDGDFIYILNPSANLLKRCGGLEGITRDDPLEVIRYRVEVVDKTCRKRIPQDIMTLQQARRLLLKEMPELSQLSFSYGKTERLPAVSKQELRARLASASPEKVFFTADTHFLDERVLQHRGLFQSVDHMDETIVRLWNETVPEDGIVLHLGDFAADGNQGQAIRIAKSLNGTKYLIWGNHDYWAFLNSKKFAAEGKLQPIGNSFIFSFQGRQFKLCHYPYLCYEGEYSGTIQLFGHVHSGGDDSGFDIKRLEYLLPYQYDVGVDNNEFRPVSLQRILELFPRYNSLEDGVNQVSAQPLKRQDS